MVPLVCLIICFMSGGVRSIAISVSACLFVCSQFFNVYNVRYLICMCIIPYKSIWCAILIMSVQFSYLKHRTSDLHEIVHARPCNVFVVLLRVRNSRTIIIIMHVACGCGSVSTAGVKYTLMSAVVVWQDKVKKKTRLLSDIFAGRSWIAKYTIWM